MILVENLLLGVELQPTLNKREATSVKEFLSRSTVEYM